MIYEAPKIGEPQIQAIATIEDIRKTLRYALQSPKRWPGLLRRNMIARAIQGSNTIEGYNVTFDEAVAVVEGEEIEVAQETRLALEGYREALTYILGRAEDPHFTFNEELVRALHYMMLSYDQGKNPGRWRPGPIYVRREPTGEIVYEGPDAEKLPGLMNEFVTSVRSLDDKSQTIVLAAMAHLNLVMIHPFSDGNGRMGRALQTLVLARDGVTHVAFASIEEYLGSRANTEAYYAVLASVGAGKWSPGRDTLPWIDFCLRAHLQQAITVQRRVRETEKLWNELEIELKNRRLDERMIYALYEASIGLKVRSPRYRAIAEISQQVASRDLKALVEQGLLVPKGEKRGRSYEASPYLLKIRDKIREPKLAAADHFKGQLDLPL